MSGTFNEIDVPPTLVSFAVDVASSKTMITPELKKAGNKLVLLKIEKDAYDLPNYDQVMDQYSKFFEDVKAGKIVSAYALDGMGLAAAVSKMAFGNHMGVKIEHNVDARDLFAPGFGDIVAEVPADQVGNLSITYTVVGEVLADQVLEYADTEDYHRGSHQGMGRYSGKGIQDLLRRRTPVRGRAFHQTRGSFCFHRKWLLSGRKHLCMQT